jgi:hypothetical protein
VKSVKVLVQIQDILPFARRKKKIHSTAFYFSTCSGVSGVQKLDDNKLSYLVQN